MILFLSPIRPGIRLYVRITPRLQWLRANNDTAQYHSPYFNQSHADLRAEAREWVENEIIPNVTEWDEAKRVPEEIYKAMGERGYLAGLLGLHKWPSHLTDKRVASVAPEKWDLFHEMLLTDELSRSGSGGFVWNVIGGFGIGCPPVVKHGKKELVERILPGILSGDKRICLAITEPGKPSCPWNTMGLFPS